MKRWIPYLLFACIFFLFFLPVIVQGPSYLMYGDDIHNQYYFYRLFFNNWIHAGVFPWWNPYYFSGAPYIADPIVNIWYPINWIYVVLPLSYAYIAHFWFHLTLGATGMYLLVKYIVKDNRSFSTPAFSSGLVFSLSGFMSARIMAGHVDVIASASYMPLVVFFFFRLMQRKKWSDVGLAGLVLGIQLLSGYHTMGFFTLIAVGFVCIGVAIKERTLTHAIPVVLAILLGFGLSAISLLPMQEFIRMSIRTIEKTYEWASIGSVPFGAFLKQLIAPFPFGRPLEYTGPVPNFFEHAFFFGRMSSCIIVIGLLTLFWKKKISVAWVIFLSLFVFGAWMSMGNTVPFDLQHFLWIVMPFYRMLRIPPRHLILVVFSASVLVGLSLSLIRNRFMKTGVLLFILLELFFYGQSFIGSKPLPETRYDRELISFLKNSKELIRTLPNFGCWIEPRSSLPFDAVMTEGIFSATGYDPTIYRPYYDFIDAANGNATSSILINDVQVPYLNLSSPAMNFLNIKYLLTPVSKADPLNGQSTDQFTLVKENVLRDYRVYENKNVLPRFFFVPSVAVFNSYEELVTAIRRQNIDFTKTVGALKNDVPMLSSTDCPADKQGSVDVITYTPNTISLHVSTLCPAFLVSSEVMYPGWKAFVDGKETPVISGNMAFRTLFVPKGEHLVEYRFVPTVFYIGSVISLLSFALIGICFLVPTFFSKKKQ